MIVVNTPELALPDDYPHLLAELKAQLRSAQWTAVRVFNTQLNELYWGIGKAILDRQNAEGWGAKVIDQLAIDLSLAFPNSMGFSRRNLHYMRRLAEAWPTPHLCSSLLHKCPGVTSSSSLTSSMSPPPGTGTSNSPWPAAGLATCS